MNLTPKEKKIARLAFDKAAKDGERAAAAAKLIESLHKRGITVEDLENITTRVVTETVYRDRPVATPQPAPSPPREPSDWSYTPVQPNAKTPAPQWDYLALARVFAGVFVLALVSALVDCSRKAQLAPIHGAHAGLAQLMTPAASPVHPNPIPSWNEITNSHTYQNADANGKRTIRDNYARDCAQDSYVLTAHRVVFGQEKWTQNITVGKCYFAYIAASGQFDAQVPVLIKGTVKNYWQLPSVKEEGDCWFIQSWGLYEVFSNNCWLEVRGMGDL